MKKKHVSEGFRMWCKFLKRSCSNNDVDLFWSTCVRITSRRIYDESEIDHQVALAGRHFLCFPLERGFLSSTTIPAEQQSFRVIRILQFLFDEHQRPSIWCIVHYCECQLYIKTVKWWLSESNPNPAINVSSVDTLLYPSFSPFTFPMECCPWQRHLLDFSFHSSPSSYS